MADSNDEILYEALRRECASVRQHLGIGATAIGQAYFEGTEWYAQAFFALSVGFERAAKLAITLDAAIANQGQYLDSTALRQFGHRIDRLLDEVARVARARGFSHASLPNTSIHQAIVQTITAFASNLGRYCSLEVLNLADSRNDPIAAWTHASQLQYSKSTPRTVGGRAMRELSRRLPRPRTCPPR